ncbi:MAG: hypothetical protein LBS46_04030 [Dysgonamonadaceae bacterium]|nr:hypothetical protein [Dysgonamonadaceae bacterium]
MKKNTYTPPTATACQIRLEGWIATSVPNLSIGNNGKVAWEEDTNIVTYGNGAGGGSGGGDTLGRDLFIYW